ncbi:pericentriolar material 1 isoform 8-like protein [Camelus ferus]|nr:pericentriolar material 1 isoform 8-like protein [Camelus ferus]
MATGGGPFEEGMNDQDLPSWSNESVDDRLNNMDWGGQQKKANRSSEKNKKKFGVESDKRVTNDISPESSPGMGRRRTKTPHTFPHSRYMTQMSVPEQAELEKLKQRINFSDLDQRSIGSDSQGRATAANNKRQLSENRKPFNFLPMQINTNKGKDAAPSPQKREMIVSRLVQIRDYITKASSMREDLVEKNERSANVERLTHLIDHLKEQEKSYMKFLQKILARENEEEDVRTVDSAVGSGSVAESTSLNIDVQSEASDTTARDPQQEPMEEIENLKKQHDLLKRMLQQQEQLRALQGRQAALLALQHKAEQAIAVMDDSEKVAGTTPGHHSVPCRQPARSPFHQRVPLREPSLSEKYSFTFSRKLNEVRKRLNELRELVHYYEQTSDMMTDAVNENTKDEETEESEYDSEHENSEPVTNIRSSLVDETPEDAEFEQKINRLMAAKQKLRQLQDLVAMVQDDDAADQGVISANTSNLDDFYPEEDTKQNANNTRGNANKIQKDAGVNEKAREKFYEAKLQQQQRELKQLQEERKKLIEIQEKIQALQKACPDLQLWSEMRRHEMLREELRQRRKQLEALMAEHQRRQGLAETASPVAVSLRSDGSENLCTPQQSRTEKTMATWGGSTQCALDEEGDEDGYLSEGVVRTDEEEEEEEQDASSNDNFSMYPPNGANRNSYNVKETKNRWKNNRPFSADGHYRPLTKTRQQNISMQRQENLRWVSELSYVEEKEQWQEQINQLKKQLDFSVNICQTLMQDQQTLSCLLQTLLTGPYSVMPSNVASPQVHLIMHQLNQCYTQLTWQQNNVQRLKQMLNELMRQQNQHPEKPGSKDRGSGASHPPSPGLFCPFSFPAQPVNLFNLPGFTNFSSFAPGMNFSPLFPSNFGDFSQNTSTPTEQQQPLAQNPSGKTEYVAFPKPFESSSSVGAEKQRNQKQPEEEVENSRTPWLYDQEGEVEKPFVKTGFTVSVEKTTNSNRKNQLDTSRRRRQFDEESLESFSSMPDPVDSTTVTKTFKTRKASAQASLASKDKTPKAKSKKRHSTQLKSRVKNIAHARRILQQSNRNACNEAPETGSDFSMFEALRDTIYSEVATLISQNESRPHFLIELFHELQLLNTDYLRQRALYALQDIVSRHISENHEKEGENGKSVNSGTWIASNSELTPSESLATTDDETFEKNFERETHKISEQNDADNASVMSVSSNFEPFATDDLGNTVIHLDQALARMREYERMKTEAESNTNIRCTCRIIEDEDGAAATTTVNNLEETPNPENHSSQQPVSEVSTIPCPRIDTQQLDRQIKAIMKEVIPFLKDSLAKFAGRKLKDCGEDLLVEISEVLFNELAFFKLMQDLDNNSITVKQRCKRKIEAAGVIQSYAKEAKRILEGDHGLPAGEIDDENKDKDKTETVKQTQTSEVYDGDGPKNVRSDVSDQEEDEESEECPVSINLSKAETQALTNYGSGEDENEDEEIEEFEEGPVDVQTSLQANTETTEENEHDDQVPQHDFEESTESKNVPSEQEPTTSKDDQDSTPVKPCYLNIVENEQHLNSAVQKDSLTTIDASKQPNPLPLPLTEIETLVPRVKEVKSAQETPESSLAGSPDTESPVLVNDYEAESGNLSQKSDEEDFVKVEDLPLKLTIYSEVSGSL